MKICPKHSQHTISHNLWAWVVLYITKVSKASNTCILSGVRTFKLTCCVCDISDTVAPSQPNAGGQDRIERRLDRDQHLTSAGRDRQKTRYRFRQVAKYANDAMLWVVQIVLLLLLTFQTAVKSADGCILLNNKLNDMWINQWHQTYNLTTWKPAKAVKCLARCDIQPQLQGSNLVYIWPKAASTCNIISGTVWNRLHYIRRIFRVA